MDSKLKGPGEGGKNSSPCTPNKGWVWGDGAGQLGNRAQSPPSNEPTFLGTIF